MDGLTGAAFPVLNLPAAELSIVESEGKRYVFDPIRKKELVLTPEEWVRQHLIYFLIEVMRYPKSLFVLERGLMYNQLAKRLDILVVDRAGKPFLIIECKAPEVTLSQRTLEQVCTYNQRIQAKYIAVSNGLKHVVLGFSSQSQTYIPMKTFPEFGA
ncbi:MAG: type I restriction enzyme HsdR N-terminal domain-containing protein [Lunatimonas sp.]|uniref:type I restriction enzyme HsdR N-terminal domain-containing protein n=1 Tax=Lunatimonas sp. TaxID=2060141 RepID=UPI00263BAF8F|nr:type I restriction enzyme HsdR N-terminal domain-containing protein [Lunatimonas sp.]MCC5939382.1 type I restriction enzyme HsdR N-terminal domain-containing protein [Lunatimonas sp.]